MDRLYYCDALINFECRKTNCFLNEGPCYMTTKPEFSIKKDGKPVMAPDIVGEKNGAV